MSHILSFSIHVGEMVGVTWWMEKGRGPVIDSGRAHITVFRLEKSLTSICLFTLQLLWLCDQDNPVICLNIVLLCVKGHGAVCACAVKSSNFGNLAAFGATFRYIFAEHVQKWLFVSFWWNLSHRLRILWCQFLMMNDILAIWRRLDFFTG